MPSFSIPLSGLDASSNELSVIANNLANLNTVGFKAQRTLFQDLFYQQINCIHSRCSRVVRNYKATTKQLDEEQERELEQEREEEREPERPAKLSPHKPVFHEGLRRLVTSPKNPSVADFVIPIGCAFERTSFSAVAAPHVGAWDPRLFVTKEFTKTVIFKTKTKEDEYQHVPNTVLALWDEEKRGLKIVILLADFEANHLLPLVRGASERGHKIPSSLHHIIARISPDQTESLLSHLSLPSSVVNEEWRKRELRPLCAQLAVFASSLYHSAKDRGLVLQFLGLVPPPGRDELTELDREQWKKLQAAKLIGPDGFVCKEGGGMKEDAYDERALVVWERTKETRFKASPVELIKKIAALRNFVGRLVWSQVGSWVETA